MITRDLDSLSSLGRSLTSARDRGVITPTQFSQAGRAIACAMLTGQMEMEAYAGIHWVLGRLIEAAFTAPAKNPGEDLGAHMETVGQLWNYVGPSGGPLASVDRFFGRVFSMEKAKFERDRRFYAPLKASPAEISKLLRAAGITVHSSGGEKIQKPSFAALVDAREDIPEMNFIIGWGVRRFALVFYS